MLSWSLFGAIGLAAGVVAWVLAALVLSAGPRTPANRRLSLALLANGTVVAGGFGLAQLTVSEPLAHGALWLVGIPVAAMAVAYLWFLATLPVPMVAWLRPRWVRLGLLVPMVAGWVGIVTRQALFVPAVEAGSPVPWIPVYGPGAQLISSWMVGVSLFALVAAISYVRNTTPGTPARVQARAYALAFGLHDLVLAGLIAFQVLHQAGSGAGTGLGQTVYHIGIPVNTIVFGSLVSYGAVRHQVLDLDLRVRRTVRHGTVAAILVGGYIAVSLVAELMVGARTSRMVGIVATGALVFALIPLLRLGDRVADQVLPEPGQDAGALSDHKLAIYRVAVEQAISGDGTISADEEGLLASLRNQMQVTDRDHAILEHFVRAGRNGSPSGLARSGEVLLGRYRVETRLSEGGQGHTLLAHDLVLDRPVVVKTLGVPAQGAEALLREARTAAAIRHPRIVVVYDVEQVGYEVLIVMEHLTGGSLAGRLAGRRLEPPAFRQLALDLLEALAAVHATGGVHRDVKPSNVLLDDRGRAKLADFGIATLPVAERTRGLTDGQTTVGTVRYMAPEQARGHQCRASADLYAVGLTLFEAYTGGPFVELRPQESLVELQMRVASAQGLDGRLEEADPLHGWFERALRPDPADRYRSAAEMREAFLAACQEAS